MILETHPSDRKAMVKAISELTGIPAVYQYVPTYAFQIGDITVNRNGTVSSDNLEALTAITPMLVENGWLDALPDTPAETPVTAAEEEAPESSPGDSEEADTREDKPDGAADSEAPDTTTVQIPEPDLNLGSAKNLIRILYTRQYLINRMLKMDRLYIDDDVIDVMIDSPLQTVSDLEALLQKQVLLGTLRGFNICGGNIEFEMPYNESRAPQWMYYSQLMEAVVRQAKASKRAKAERQEPANDKYMANAWLNRLGFGGPDFKELRHALMAHLNGYAAFKDNDRMQKHKDKLAEQRRIRRELNEEAHGND